MILFVCDDFLRIMSIFHPPHLSGAGIPVCAPRVDTAATGSHHQPLIPQVA